MDGFERLIAPERDSEKRHLAAAEFFVSLKEKTAGDKEKDPLEDAVKQRRTRAKTVSVVSESKALVPTRVAKGGLTPQTTRKPAGIKQVGQGQLAARMRKIIRVKKPSTRGARIKQRRFDPDKNKLVLASALKNSLTKRAMIGDLIRGVASSAQRGGRSLGGWWGANKEGLSGTMAGLTSEKETLKALLGRKLGNFGRGLGGRSPHLSAAERAAARGTEYEHGFLRGQDLNKQLGLSPLTSEFRTAISGPGGAVTPGSTYRGLEQLGLLSGPALLGLGARAKAGLSEINVARMAARRKRQLMMAGGAAAGLGGLAYLKSGRDPNPEGAV